MFQVIDPSPVESVNLLICELYFHNRIFNSNKEIQNIEWTNKEDCHQIRLTLKLLDLTLEISKLELELETKITTYYTHGSSCKDNRLSSTVCSCTL